MRRVFRAAVVALAMGSAAGLAADGVGPFNIELKGDGFDERCLRLEAGQSIHYRFSASAPVDFNIHYHRGKDVSYPVKQVAVREAGGSFRAESGEDYCLMWENRSTGAASVSGAIAR